MRSKLGRLYTLVLVFSAAILYGTTYQQFRFFDLADPGGASDATYYTRMSQGDYEFSENHRYRWLTPTLAQLIRPVLENAVQDENLSVKLSFYLVNFAFSLGTCIALFALLQAMGFSIPLSLLGVCGFASSRITVLVTGTPLADAAYFCAIAILLYLAVAKKRWTLTVLLPVIVLSKETVLLFLLLPLLTDMRKFRAYWVALVVSILTFMVSRRVIDSLHPSNASNIWETTLNHLETVPENLGSLLTLAGIHDLQNGFSFLLLLAAMGVWLNARHRYHVIPLVVLATVPIGLGYAFLSGNLGRMFFAAFPAVIAYALVSIDHVSRTCGQGNSAR
jgi:hypothetical protein